MMHLISELAEKRTGGVLSRPNRQQAVRLLSGALSEPLKNILKEAVEEFESERKSDDAGGETSSTQFVLLVVLGLAAAIYLSNKRARNTSSISEESRGERKYSATESREQAAASDTMNTEPSEESESDDHDDMEGDDEGS